jgi:hypothetical protein
VSTQVSSWLNFTPLSLNPYLWLDASDTSTITESGGAVSQWNDKSGNGYTFTQGTGAAQPKTGTRTKNGLNVLDFDGGDSLISTAAASTWKFLHDTTVPYIFAAVVARDVAGVIGTIATTSNSATAVGAGFRFLPDNTISHVILNGGGVVSNNPSLGTTTEAITFVVNADYSLAVLDRSIIFANYGQYMRTNVSTQGPGSGDPTTSLTIGNRQVNVAALDGIIGEMIIVPTTSTSLNTLFVLKQYLSAKWGAP